MTEPIGTTDKNPDKNLHKGTSRQDRESTVPVKDKSPVESAGSVKDATPVEDTASSENAGSVKDATPVEDTASVLEESLTESLARRRRQHPAAAFTHVLRTLREFLIPILLFIFLGTGGNSFLFSWQGFSVFLLTLLVIGVLNWFRFTWRVEEDELRIDKGVLVRSKRYLPRDRIQAIDISMGPIQRLFGLVRLKVLTAGGSSPEAEISAITLADARRIQKVLQVEVRGLTNGSVAEAEEDTSRWPVYRLSKKRLLLAASTSASFGVALSIVATLIAQIHQVVDEATILGFLEARLGGVTADTWIALATGAVIIAWLLSVFGTLFRFSGFHLKRNRKELQIRRGLFEKKLITIPYHRIQAVRVVEGILRQPLGFAMVYIENAGFGDEGGGSTVVNPLIRKTELDQFLSDMLPDYHVELPIVKPPKRAFLRYQIRLFVPVVAVTSLLSWLTGWYLLFAPFVLLAGLAAWLSCRDAAAGFDRENGFIRYRRLARTTAFFHRRRVQSLSVLANWFQRRKELCSIVATVASGESGMSFRVDHLSANDGGAWLEWYGVDRKTTIAGFYPAGKPAG